MSQIKISFSYYSVAAEEEEEAAKEELKKRRKEVDKLETHQKDWEKMMRLELEVIEQRELDELGSTMFLTRKQKQS